MDIITMKSFREYIGKEDIDQELVENIKQVLILRDYGDELLNEGYFENNDSLLTEGLKNAVNQSFSKLNIKKEKGLFSYLRSAGKGVAQIFTAAVKGDKEKIKETLKTVKRKDVLDFVLKLDLGFAHALSSPIHLIDAVTGFEIWDAIVAQTKEMKPIGKKISDAISYVKNDIVKVILNKTRVSKYKTFLNGMQKDVDSAIAVS